MRILFAWELGDNFGHVAKIAGVAEHLAERGAEIFLCLKTPAHGQVFARNARVRLLQAPFHHSAAESGGEERAVGATYAEMSRAYDSADNLTPLVQAWRSLYELIRPDGLVAEFAPTAQLAARGLGFPTAMLGTGYSLPPLTVPMRPMRYWRQHDPAELMKREGRVLGVVNETLARLQLPPLGAYREMLESDASFLCTFAELDHYPERGQATYYGPIFSTDTGREMEWRPGARKHILVYLRPGQPSFVTCIEILRRLPPDHDIVAALPGMPEAMRRQIETPSLRVVGGPVRFDRLLPDCDLVINNGNAGTCAAMAWAGVPMLMLPMQVEQGMMAQAAMRAGLGLLADAKLAAPELGAMLHRLLSEPGFKAKAKAFAQKYADFEPGQVTRRVADEIEALLRRKALARS